MPNNEQLNKKIFTYTLVGYFCFLIYQNFTKIFNKLEDLNLKPWNQIVSDFFNPLFWFALLTGNLEMYTPKKGGTLEVGNVSLLETESTGYSDKAKYFKISEYMGKYPIPEIFKGNLDLLFFNLDKIRDKWGSALVIATGYDGRPYTDLNTSSCYQRCLCVRLYPKVGTTILLNQLILQMRDNKQITNCIINHEVNKYIYISFTKPD